MLIPSETTTPSSLSWQQARAIFTTLASHTPTEHGLGAGARAILHDMHKLEATSTPFLAEHAIAYLAALSSHQYAQFCASSTTMSEYTAMVCTAYQLAMAIFCVMPGNTISTLPELVDELSITLSTDQRMAMISRDILRHVKEGCERGLYRDTAALRNELLRYIDAIMTGKFTQDTRHAATSACCCILMHFH